MFICQTAEGVHGQRKAGNPCFPGSGNKKTLVTKAKHLALVFRSNK